MEILSIVVDGKKEKMSGSTKMVSGNSGAIYPFPTVI